MRTFVVRLWSGAAELGSDARRLRGLREEVETGEAVTFAGGDQLIGALERAQTRVTRQQDRSGTPAGEGRLAMEGSS